MLVGALALYGGFLDVEESLYHLQLQGFQSLHNLDSHALYVLI